MAEVDKVVDVDDDVVIFSPIFFDDEKLCDRFGSKNVVEK